MLVEEEEAMALGLEEQVLESLTFLVLVKTAFQEMARASIPRLLLFAFSLVVEVGEEDRTMKDLLIPFRFILDKQVAA